MISGKFNPKNNGNNIDSCRLFFKFHKLVPNPNLFNKILWECSNVNNQWVPSSVILRIYLEETPTILRTKPTTFFVLLLDPIFAKSKVVGSFKWFFYKKNSCLLLWKAQLKKVLDLHMDGCSDVIESICLKPTCLISCKLQGNPMIHHQSQQAPKGVSY
jgi:hypothetical protein